TNISTPLIMLVRIMATDNTMKYTSVLEFAPNMYASNKELANPALRAIILNPTERTNPFLYDSDFRNIGSAIKNFFSLIRIVYSGRCHIRFCSVRQQFRVIFLW